MILRQVMQVYLLKSLEDLTINIVDVLINKYYVVLQT